MTQIYAQINNIPEDNISNNLYQDLALVQKLIDTINSELSNQLKEIHHKLQNKEEIEKERKMAAALANLMDSEDTIA